MPVPTPWIRTYDTPELYLGGYKSGVAAAQVGQQAQIAGMEAANRLQIAQMETAARQDIANKQLLAQQHRAAIEDQYKQTQFGLQRQELEAKAKMDQMKLDEAARQAATQLEYQKRFRAGEDPVRLAQELGPTMGMPWYRPTATRAQEDPYAKDMGMVQRGRLEQLYKDLGVATKPEQKEGVLTEIWKANNEMRQNRGMAPLPANPLPNDERLLVRGRVYQTTQGPAVWNGKKLVTID